MRTAFQFALAVMVSAVSFSSCTKNLIQDNGSDPAAPATEGTRTIAVSFAPQTKTALGKDGLTPEFLGGEKIKIALTDGLSAPEEKEVAIENGIAVIHTDLEGELDAVYPASAAKVEGNKITGISVSSTQTGKFADANICRATIPAGSQSATFENETAILKFYVDKSIGVKSITIAGKENVADGSSSIKIDGTDENSILSEIIKGTSNERICYVAVLAGDHSALSFTSETSTQSALVQKQLQPETLLAGTMYNVFLPYYIQVGDHKWGYCNVGAFLPEEPGYYFSWGNVEGYNLNGKSDTYSFTIEEYKTTKGYNLSKNISPDNDAAYKNWGASWRIPTMAEFLQTINFNNGEWVDNNFGIAGYLFETSKLFLPAAGYYDMERYPSYEEYSTHGRYWTSDYKDDGENAELFHVDKENKWETADSRYKGYPIRPIYGDPEDGALKGVFTVSDGCTPGNTSDDIMVRFSQGNLRYTVNTKKWSFYEHQYDCATGYDANLISLFTWGYSENTSTVPYGEDYVTGYTKNGDNLVYDKSSSEGGDDWGVAYCESNKITVGTWRTLTTDEWQYLFNTRATLTNTGTDNARYAKATVGSISGIILLPDKYEHPSGVAALTNINTSDAGYTANSYDVTTWAAMEDAGAVFLPAADYRSGDEVDYGNTFGSYWSSTVFINEQNDDYAYCVEFDSTNSNVDPENNYLDPEYVDERAYGCSVRLVANVSAAPAPTAP